MDIGIPIVTTDIGGNPEIIENEKSGLLIGFNDEKEIEKSVIKLLNNKKYGNTLVRQAQKKVQEFSEEKMIKEYLKSQEVRLTSKVLGMGQSLLLMLFSVVALLKVD